jgi:hypothetical protein
MNNPPTYPENVGDPLPMEETDQTIASDKVEGTTVYNGHGEKLGHIHNFMIDKRSGQVLYAVLSFGGFLGLGERYHPLPWKVLKYDEEQGGYVVGISKDALADAPSFPPGEFPAFTGSYGAGVYGYWGVPFPI